MARFTSAWDNAHPPSPLHRTKPAARWRWLFADSLRIRPISDSAMFVVDAAPILAKSWCRNRLDTCCPWSTDHLWVILHTRQPTFPVLERRNGSSSAGGHHIESIGSGCDRVAVAHPHRLRHRQIRMQPSPRHIHFRPTVLVVPSWRPCRRAPARWPETRSRCRTPAPRGRIPPDSVAVPSAYTLAGPPDSTMACGSRALMSSTLAVWAITSEYTLASRRRRAMSGAYCAPKSTTNTGRGRGRFTSSV